MSQIVVVVLPWPPAALSPNARGHWAVRYTAGQKAKHNAYWTTREITARRKPKFRRGAEIPVYIVFQPPDSRRHDSDNVLASCKAYLDGIAESLNVDDLAFNPITVFRAPPAKDGLIAFTIGETK